MFCISVLTVDFFLFRLFGNCDPVNFSTLETFSRKEFSLMILPTVKLYRLALMDRSRSTSVCRDLTLASEASLCSGNRGESGVPQSASGCLVTTATQSVTSPPLDWKSLITTEACSS